MGSGTYISAARASKLLVSQAGMVASCPSYLRHRVGIEDNFTIRPEMRLRGRGWVVIVADMDFWRKFVGKRRESYIKFGGLVLLTLR